MRGLIFKINLLCLREQVPIQALNWDGALGLLVNEHGFSTIHTFAPEDAEWVVRRVIEIKQHGIHKDRSSFNDIIPVP